MKWQDVMQSGVVRWLAGRVTLALLAAAAGALATLGLVPPEVVAYLQGL